MAGLRDSWRRLRGLWRGGALDRRADEEIRFHLEQQAAKNIARGMSPDDARRDAHVRFGGVEAMREAVRDEVRPTLVEDFVRDVRIGVRLLWRSPGFAAAVVLTMGLGIGAATAVFSLVNDVLVQPLSYPRADRIVRLFQIDAKGQTNRNVSDPNFLDWRAETHGFAAMAEMSPPSQASVAGGSEPHMATATWVSRSFFDVLGVHPAQGRGFAGDEQQVGGPRAAIVSHAYWDRWFGPTAAVAGQTLRLSGDSYTVVGIMPAGFDYPDGTEVWMSRDLLPYSTARAAHNFQAVARLRDGVTLAAAQGELSGVSRALKAKYGDDTWMSDAAAVPLLDDLTAGSRLTLQVLFGAALLLLIVACMNVSNLLLARAAARRHEFAIQLAVGASRSRLARQLVAETLVVCAAGGLVGVALAAWLVHGVVALNPAGTPRLAQAHVDWMALGFAFGVAGLSALALGLLTAGGRRGVRLAGVLAEGPRTGTDARRSLRAREALVVVQVAVTLVLLAGAGLLAQSLFRLMAVNPGYRLDNALLLDFRMPSADDDASAQARRIAFQHDLLARLQGLPGVTGAGLVNGFPLGGLDYSNGQFLKMTSIDEIASFDDVAKLGPEVKARAGFAGFRVASAGYFKAMGIPLRRGRLFGDGDTRDAPHVAVVSQSLADAAWPGQDPVGRYVQFGNMDGDLRGFRVVGVVGDVRERTPASAPGPLFYADYQQRPGHGGRFTAIVRGGAPDTLAVAARRIVRDLAPDLPVQTRTLGAALGTTFSSRRFTVILTATFAASALALAMLGLYGLIAFAVAQRAREMGIRLALGATSNDLVRAVLLKGAMLSVAGAVAGIGIALLLTRTIQSLLFGVTAADPVVFGLVAALTLAASLVATLPPARRAARVDPVSTLR